MDNPEFFRGAQVAYRDCAKFVLELSMNLPPDLFFLRDSYVNMANSFVEKSNGLNLFMLETQGEA